MQKITAVCISNLRTFFRCPRTRQQPAKATRRRAFLIASIFDQFVASLTFPFGNKFFNSFRDSGLPNVTERWKENLFPLICSMMSKNSKSVNKYISII